MKQKSIVVVHNQKSGSSIDPVDLKKIFERYGYKVKIMIPIGDGFSSKLRRHLKSGTLVAAVGGDGTISAATPTIIKAGAVLIPIPGGTLNNFTKDLGVEQDIERAVEKSYSAKPSKVDVSSVNGIVFINNSSIGIYPESLLTRKRIEDKFGKWPSAIFGVARAIVRFRLYDIAVDSKSISTPFIFVGNGDYRIDQPAPGRDDVTSGLLSVYVLKTSSRYELVKLFFQALFGKLNDSENIDIHHIDQITITTKHKRKLSVSRDGEVSKVSSPITYKMHKSKLNVIR
jgi:diacylglycerol kinase family enzyme